MHGLSSGKFEGVQVSCTVDTIEAALEEVFRRELVPYNPGDAKPIADAINDLFP